MRIEVTIPGEPVGKARPRVTWHGTYTPAKTKHYEANIQACWMEQSGKKFPDEIPIRVDIECAFSIPKSYAKKLRTSLPGKPHNKRPDIDNCIKSALDGLQGYAFSEDSKICEVNARKIYTDGQPYMRIVMENVDEDAS